MFALVFMKFEYGEMSKYEKAVQIMNEPTDDDDDIQGTGTVFDLVFPIATLIVFCTLGMIYSGGFFTPLIEGEAEGEMAANPAFHNFIEAFANSDASIGLVLG